MLEALIFLTVSLVIFLTLTEIISLRLSYSQVLRAEINFMLFGISFVWNKEASKKKKRKGSKRHKPAKSLMLFLLRSIIKAAEVEISELHIDIDDENPMSAALKYGGFLSLLSSLIAYLRVNAKKFRYDNIICSSGDNNKFNISFDVRATLSLLSTLGALFKSIYYYIKEGKIKNVRKQNE